MPWRTALEICETRVVPIPALLIERYVRSFSRFPAYLIRFFKYPCVITDAAFRRDFGWEAQVDIKETLRSAVASARLVATH